VHEKTKSALSREALERIAAFYKIEDTIRGQLPDQRLRVRCQYLAPLMADMHAWLEVSLTRISGRSDMAKAIRYSLKRWDALTLVLRDGRACIDNSAAERAMRPIALGRRNWTFAGSDAGGLRAAAIYSLIETCLCRARHRAVYAARRTMPNGLGFPRAGCDLDMIGSA